MEGRVRDASRRFAGLTAVDGATIVTDRYDLVAFGAKIARRRGSPTVENVVVTEPIVGGVAETVHPTRLGGTRHRSAAHSCTTSATRWRSSPHKTGRFTVFAWSPARRWSTRIASRPCYCELYRPPPQGVSAADDAVGGLNHRVTNAIQGRKRASNPPSPATATVRPGRGDAGPVAGFGELSDWESFAASWHRLETRHYMADGGRYRRRRHAVFSANAGTAIIRETASAALSGARLQPAAWRRGALVRADSR